MVLPAPSPATLPPSPTSKPLAMDRPPAVEKMISADAALPIKATPLPSPVLTSRMVLAVLCDARYWPSVSCYAVSERIVNSAYGRCYAMPGTDLLLTGQHAAPLSRARQPPGLRPLSLRLGRLL
eukprot:2275377-Rhodomonas_salina.1